MFKTNRKTIIALFVIMAVFMSATACSSNAAATDSAVVPTVAATVTTNEPTETAAVTTVETTAAETMAVSVTTLAVPADYTANMDNVIIYADSTRAVKQGSLKKGEQITITGTADKYGVTAEGYFINLHLMTIVVPVTPTPAETTAAHTDPTAATTKAPATTTATTKAPAATTQTTTAATTATPPVETTAAPATDYTAVCADIRSKVIAILEANGQWDEAYTGKNNSGGSQWWGVGFYDDGEMSTDDFAQHFYANKFDGMAICGTSITCYMADGNINIAYKGYWTS